MCRDLNSYIDLLKPKNVRCTQIERGTMGNQDNHCFTKRWRDWSLSTQARVSFGVEREKGMIILANLKRLCASAKSSLSVTAVPVSFPLHWSPHVAG